MDVNCVVLAGGKSTRLGRNKVDEIVGQKSLLERVISQLVPLDNEIIVVISRGSAVPKLTQYSHVKLVKDIFPGKGSLGGAFTGLTYSNTFYNLVVAGDMPFLNINLLKYLINLAEKNSTDVVIPRMYNDILEPLHAVYSKQCLPAMEKLICANRLSILDLFPFVKVTYVEEEESRKLDVNHLSFFNVNTEADLTRGKELAEKEDLGMISVEQALEKVLNTIEVLGEEERPLPDCLGQVLAENIYSSIDVPPKDNSALDGYAVRAADIKNATKDHPRILKVIDTIVAGSNPRKAVTPGTAVRIMTGAPTPPGADVVIGFEETDENVRTVSSGGTLAEIGIMLAQDSGANIRKAGESIKKGELVLAKGTILRPSEVGVLASLGRAKIKVIKRPVVSILATGDELTALGEPLGEGKIYNSNTYSVSAQVQRDGGVPRLLGIALDNEASLVAKINQALDADLLITIGGVSMGDYDVVKDVLAKQGEIVFWKVRTKPGKPLAFGTIRRIGIGDFVKDMPHLGLAGNAVSCMVNYELFVRPAILKMMGKKNLNKPVIQATIEDSINNEDGRRVFARVIVEKRDRKYFARLTGPQGSGILRSMALANGLAIVPEDRPHINKGETLEVMMLDWCQDI